MNKKIVIVATIITIITLAIIISVFIFPLITQPKIEVTNLYVQFANPGWALYFRITNDYNSPITNVGYSLVESGFTDVKSFQVPPGQTQDSNNFLGNDHSIAVLSDSQLCTVKLTFTFADGKYSTYSQTVTPLD
jgi:hypothetical protein